MRLLTITQACERVQLSRWTLHRAIGRGELEGIRFGRLIRVSEEALEAWVNAGIIEPSGSAKSRIPARTGGAASKHHSKLAPNYFRQAAKERTST